MGNGVARRHAVEFSDDIRDGREAGGREQFGIGPHGEQLAQLGAERDGRAVGFGEITEESFPEEVHVRCVGGGRVGRGAHAFADVVDQVQGRELLLGVIGGTEVVFDGLDDLGGELLEVFGDHRQGLNVRHTVEGEGEPGQETEEVRGWGWGEGDNGLREPTSRRIRERFRFVRRT